MSHESTILSDIAELNPLLQWSTIATVVILGILILRIGLRQRSTLPFPPGPRKDPFLGHLRIMPTANHGEVFHKWAQIHGDIISLQVLGRNIIILNSLEAAHELLDNRGANYSCRPNFVVFTLMGWAPTLTFMQYGKDFFKHRKMFQNFLGKQESAEYIPIQTKYSEVLVKNLMETPARFDWCLEKYTTSVIMFVISGHEIIKDDEIFIEMASDASNCMNNAGPTGSTPVDLFPLLQYFPSWFPGTFYANHARNSYKIIRRLHDIPVEYVRERINNGTARPSLVFHLLEAMGAEIETLDSLKEREKLSEEEVWHIKGVAGTAYLAGGDTTYTTLRVFFLVMTLNPQIQKKAQDEIDRVLGMDNKGVNRLPDIEDREKLPFVECVLQETLRFCPVVSMGIPHRSLEDDIYKGMFIPKGSIVFANARGMSLDERIYSEPRIFNPMRFMPVEKGGKGEPYFIGGWGFGRRICPGRHLADTELWLAIATILATLDIRRAKDEDGNEITPELKFSDGIINSPLPFKCDIKPRSDEMMKLYGPSQNQA